MIQAHRLVKSRAVRPECWSDHEILGAVACFRVCSRRVRFETVRRWCIRFGSVYANRPRTSIILELAPKSGTGGTEYVALRWPGNAQFFHASLERRGLECQDCGGAPDAANSPLGGIEYRFYVIVFNLVQRSEVVFVL